MSDQCFYVPGTEGRVPSIIDVCRTDDQGRTVTYFHGMTLDELRKAHPRAELGNIEDVVRMKEDVLKSEPISITEDQYMDALEVLPPLDYQHKGNGNSFKMVERLSGRITTVYARMGDSYWCFNDVDTITHAEIMAKVARAIRGE